ncbi:MAG: hypothetical protein H6765_03005 [Candidatus Peribacteria bacterium]|nr:MAG: hypothetical protein H6765_03005 [Candidatus Peribacteria bacterium]
MPPVFETQSADAVAEMQKLAEEGYSLTDLEVVLQDSGKKLLQNFDVEKM